MTSSTPIFSESLQENIVLHGDAFKFYERISMNEDYFQEEDPNAYNVLIDLGYKYKTHYHLFEGETPVSIEWLTDYKVSPEMASYANEFLILGEEEYLSPNSWLAEAISMTNVDKSRKVEMRGWYINFAIIIAAFPEREARLEEVFEHGLGYQNGYIYSDYDVSMLARLDTIPNAHAEIIIELLDKGYTENEIKDYGIHLTRYFTLEELRESTANPTVLKNIFTIFKTEAYYRNKNSFVPTLEQLEGLASSGVKNGKQYKEIAKMLGMNPKSQELANTVPTVLNTISYDDLKKLYKGKAGFTLSSALFSSSVSDAYGA